MHIHYVNNIICYYIFVNMLLCLLFYYVFYSVTLSIQAATSSTLGF